MTYCFKGFSVLLSNSERVRNVFEFSLDNQRWFGLWFGILFYSLKTIVILILFIIYIVGGDFINMREMDCHVRNLPPLEKAIQSVIWIGFGITGALTYLCALHVPPYSNDDDFFRVTLVKLYFEGPKCILDGSYLGKFNEKYRKLDLFTPDLVFSVMVGYVIVNAIYFILSLKLYLERNKHKRGLALSWSGLTLILCVADAIIGFRLLIDFFTLRLHMDDDDSDTLQVVINSASNSIRGISYISLILALVSVRFFFFWLWNLIIGLSLFLDALCCRKIVGKPSKNEKPKGEQRVEVEDKAQQVPKKEEPSEPKEDPLTSISLLNGKYQSSFDVKTNPDYLDFRKSLEAVTRFSSIPDNSSLYRENINRHWGYGASNEAYWQPPTKSQTGKEWEMTNEGFISDEPMPVDPDRQLDFDHNLKNFEPGHRKIKIVKPPIGKPVSIPVPPPLPTSGSCNC